ncbi:MAG TPA: hypothetical protein VJV96_16600 [Candidatus Angelobacter sp.]|nr:hypothetical protein [Candidatus Angelobacter sp.]
MKSIAANVLLLAALLGPSLYAQPQEAPKATLPSSSSASSQATADMQSLIKALSGKWSLEVKFESDKPAPNAAIQHGEEVWRATHGDLTFLQEERLPIAGEELVLLGVIWWDSKTKDFHGMECNNHSPHVCDVKGSLTDISIQWDGKAFVINEQEPSPSGGRRLWRESILDITPTSFTQTGDTCNLDGSGCKRLLTIHATRTAPAEEAQN